MLHTRQDKKNHRKNNDFEIITCDLSMISNDHPKFVALTRGKNPLLHKGLNTEHVSSEATCRCFLYRLYIIHYN